MIQKIVEKSSFHFQYFTALYFSAYSAILYRPYRRLSRVPLADLNNKFFDAYRERKIWKSWIKNPTILLQNQSQTRFNLAGLKNKKTALTKITQHLTVVWNQKLFIYSLDRERCASKWNLAISSPALWCAQLATAKC